MFQLFILLPSAILQLEIMPNVFIKTFGCQMNERDREAVAQEVLLISDFSSSFFDMFAK
jgi:hypothetical protein